MDGHPICQISGNTQRGDGGYLSLATGGRNNRHSVGVGPTHRVSFDHAMCYCTYRYS